MLPADFDRLSFREILLVISSSSDAELESWKRAATISTYVYNYGGPRGKKFRYSSESKLFPELYGAKRLDAGDIKRRTEQANKAEAEYLEQVAKAEKRRSESR